MLGRKQEVREEEGRTGISLVGVVTEVITTLCDVQVLGGDDLVEGVG